MSARFASDSAASSSTASTIVSTTSLPTETEATFLAPGSTQATTVPGTSARPGSTSPSTTVATVVTTTTATTTSTVSPELRATTTTVAGGVSGTAFDQPTAPWALSTANIAQQIAYGGTGCIGDCPYDPRSYGPLEFTNGGVVSTSVDGDVCFDRWRGDDVVDPDDLLLPWLGPYVESVETAEPFAEPVTEPLGPSAIVDVCLSGLPADGGVVEIRRPDAVVGQFSVPLDNEYGFAAVSLQFASNALPGQ